MKELVGKVLYTIGLLVVKLGAAITNAGFVISGISKEKAQGILTSMWPTEWSIEPPVKKYKTLNDKGAFVRADGEI